MNFGIIGVGRFGTNYLKTLNELQVHVKWICSTKLETMNEALSKVNLKSEVKKTINYREILKDKGLDAVIIATPGSTHYKIAKDALVAGKHVLVEKPFCLSSKEAEDLLKLSKKKNKILIAGHLHLFNPGIQKIREDIKSGLFGRVNFISIFHSGNGPVRADISALWDFFPHSVSVLLYLLEENPVELGVIGASFIKKGNEDLVTMSINFPSNIFAVSTGTWLYPLKKFEIVVVGENLYAVFDDYAKIGKLRYFDSRPKMINGKIIIDGKGYRSVQIEDSRPLTEQMKFFINCIKNNKIPKENIKNAVKITKILELAQKSLKTNSRVKVNKL